MEEPEVISRQGSEQKPAKKTIATILILAIIAGILIILFAINWSLIDLLPGVDKWNWFLYETTWGIRILISGAALLEFFFVLTLSIYIWKRGRNYLMKHI